MVHLSPIFLPCPPPPPTPSLLLQVRRVGAKPPVEREPHALYCFGLKNPLRKLLLEIVENKYFEVESKWVYYPGDVDQDNWIESLEDDVADDGSEASYTSSVGDESHFAGVYPVGDLRHVSLSRGLPAHVQWRHHRDQRVPGEKRQSWTNRNITSMSMFTSIHSQTHCNIVAHPPKYIN